MHFLVLLTVNDFFALLVRIFIINIVFSNSLLRIVFFNYILCRLCSDIVSVVATVFCVKIEFFIQYYFAEKSYSVRFRRSLPPKRNPEDCAPSYPLKKCCPLPLKKA
jgi:uncharacterized membrane protein YciS (DUF1049 family)